MMTLETPYYLIDEERLLKNLNKIKYLRENCGAKFLLALKCFSCWSVFSLMKKYMDGTTSSSPYEVRLGYEKFGKEVHSYCVAYSNDDIREISPFADKIIFNSLSQLKKFSPHIRGIQLGLRLNPLISYSQFDLADPNRKFSRLGVIGRKNLSSVLSQISGVMFHFNCENNDFNNFASNLEYISHNYGNILKRLKWVSLGGGIYFTRDGYPWEELGKKLREFSEHFKIQVYLEPGESAITQSAELVTRVLDIVRNKIDIAIVDASIETNMLDLLIYRTTAKMDTGGPFKYMVAGRSCLAGDIFGTFRFKSKLKIGSIIKFSDAAGYTMVKKNWFNGLKMPSIAVKRLNGRVDLVRQFNYRDFVNSLS